MNPQQRHTITKAIDNVLFFLWGLLLLVFPFFMLTNTTENFVFPKQILLGVVVLVSLVLLAAKMMISQRVRLRRTPFDVPVGLFTVALLVSAIFAINRADALIAFVPALFALLSYFIIVNVLRKENATVFALSALVTSATALAVLAIFSYLKVYTIPLAFTHTQSFTPLGSLLEQALFLLAILPIAIHMGLPLLKGDTNSKTVGFAAAALLIGAGVLVAVAQLLTTQKPILLPFETGFQTAFAAISQDTGRIAQGFFFGGGFGNYASVFTRFKQASFNSYPNIWYIPFTQSSSFVLELLATTGLIGILSFFLLLFRALTHPNKKKLNPMYFSLVILAIAAFILPFSFEDVALLFFVLGLFAAVESIKHPSHFFDIEPRFVTLKKGLISLEQATESQQRQEYNLVMPVGFSILIVIFVGVVGLYAGRFVLSDVYFQQSLVAANNNNGSATYTEQVAAINTFPYQSVYYRIFAQTNIALANSLANAQPKGSSPSAQVQNTIYSLLQQGITTARSATNLSPQTVANWQNLASVYRSLIGLGQNADTFAIQATQQAVVLDPTNPDEFVTLGGLYYQLGQYDNAISAFQQAIQLKQDYANAYYNLGHAYLQKQDSQDALQAFQVVEQLTVNDKPNHEKIVSEINTLQKSQQQSGTSATTPSVTPAPTKTPSSSVQEPLNLGGPQQPNTVSPTPTP